MIQAVVERDQTKIELAETQKRLKALINEMDDKIANEKQNIQIISQQKSSENTAQVIKTKSTLRDDKNPINSRSKN